MAALVFEASVLVPTFILLGALPFYSIITFVDAALHTPLRSITVIVSALNLSYPEIKTLLTERHTLQCSLYLRESVALTFSI